MRWRRGLLYLSSASIPRPGGFSAHVHAPHSRLHIVRRIRVRVLSPPEGCTSRERSERASVRRRHHQIVHRGLRVSPVVALMSGVWQGGGHASLARVTHRWKGRLRSVGRGGGEGRGQCVGESDAMPLLMVRARRGRKRIPSRSRSSVCVSCTLRYARGDVRERRILRSEERKSLIVLHVILRRRSRHVLRRPSHAFASRVRVPRSVKASDEND